MENYSLRTICDAVNIPDDLMSEVQMLPESAQIRHPITHLSFDVVLLGYILRRECPRKASTISDTGRDVAKRLTLLSLD
jgi:hypothetical protein